MTRRRPLLNPYAERLWDGDRDEPPPAMRYLVAGALTAGVVAGGAAAVPGVATAGTDVTTPGYRADPVQNPGEIDAGEIGSGRTGADAREAARFVGRVGRQLARDRADFEERIARLPSSSGPAVRPDLDRAREAFRSLWQPGSASILDLASSIGQAALAAQPDLTGPDLPGPDLAEPGRAVAQIGSPALALVPAVAATTAGPELLRRAAGWIERMTDDLYDSVERLFGAIEGVTPAGGSPAHSPALGPPAGGGGR